MIGDTVQTARDEELRAWLESIPLSKSTKNLARDFSDAVLIAEVLKLYYPRFVELHNYVSTSNLSTKRENWNTLNRKVLAKIDVKLSKDTIHLLTNASQGAIEKLLSELRTRILRDAQGDKVGKSKLKSAAEGSDVLTSQKIEDISLDNVIGDWKYHDDKSERIESTKMSDVITHDTLIDKPICEFKPSRLAQLKARIFIVFSWIVSFFRNIRIFSHCNTVLANVATEQIEDTSEESVSCAVYAELKQELREKKKTICTLNDRIAYLESTMKLKDLRISILTTQILQNAVEIDHSAKSELRDGVKSRLQSRKSHENQNGLKNL